MSPYVEGLTFVALAVSVVYGLVYAIWLRER